MNLVEEGQAYLRTSAVLSFTDNPAKPGMTSIACPDGLSGLLAAASPSASKEEKTYSSLRAHPYYEDGDLAILALKIPFMQRLEDEHHLQAFVCLK